MKCNSQGLATNQKPKSKSVSFPVFLKKTQLLNYTLHLSFYLILSFLDNCWCNFWFYDKQKLKRQQDRMRVNEEKGAEHANNEKTKLTTDEVLTPTFIWSQKNSVHSVDQFQQTLASSTSMHVSKENTVNWWKCKPINECLTFGNISIVPEWF